MDANVVLVACKLINLTRRYFLPSSSRFATWTDGLDVPPPRPAYPQSSWLDHIGVLHHRNTQCFNAPIPESNVLLLSGAIAVVFVTLVIGFCRTGGKGLLKSTSRPTPSFNVFSPVLNVGERCFGLILSLFAAWYIVVTDLTLLLPPMIQKRKYYVVLDDLDATSRALAVTVQKSDLAQELDAARISRLNRRLSKETNRANRNSRRIAAKGIALQNTSDEKTILATIKDELEEQVSDLLQKADDAQVSHANVLSVKGSEIEQLQESVASEAQTSAGLSEQLKTKDSQMETLRATIASLQKDLNEERSASVALAENHTLAANEATSRIERFTNEISTLTASNADLTAQVTTLAEEKTSLAVEHNHQATESTVRISELSAEISTEKEEHAQLTKDTEANVLETASLLESATANIAELELVMAAEKVVIQALSVDLEVQKQLKFASIEMLGRAKQECRRLEQRNIGLSMEVNHVRKVLHSRQAATAPVYNIPGAGASNSSPITEQTVTPSPPAHPSISPRHQRTLSLPFSPEGLSTPRFSSNNEGEEMPSLSTAPMGRRRERTAPASRVMPFWMVSNATAQEVGSNSQWFTDKVTLERQSSTSSLSDIAAGEALYPSIALNGDVMESSHPTLTEYNLGHQSPQHSVYVHGNDIADQSCALTAHPPSPPLTPPKVVITELGASSAASTPDTSPEEISLQDVASSIQAFNTPSPPSSTFATPSQSTRGVPSESVDGATSISEAHSPLSGPRSSNQLQASAPSRRRTLQRCPSFLDAIGRLTPPGTEPNPQAHRTHNNPPRVYGRLSEQRISRRPPSGATAVVMRADSQTRALDSLSSLASNAKLSQ